MADLADTLAGVPASEAVLPGTDNLLAELAAVEAEQSDEPETDAETPDAKKDAEPVKPKEPKEKEGKPAVSERAALRAERREFKNTRDRVVAELDGRERKIAELANQAKRELEEEAARLPDKFKKLYKESQFSELAKMFDEDDFQKVVDQWILHNTDPSYKYSRKIEEDQKKIKAELEAAKADKLKQEREWQQRQQQEQMAANERAAIAKLGGMLKSSEDSAVARLAEKDPNFTIAVLREIQRDDSLDVDEAAQNVREKAAALRALLDEAFADGVQTPGKSEAGKPATPVRAGSQKPLAKPNKHVSRTTASEASPPADDDLTDAQWLALASQEMKKAQRADEESKRQR